MDIIEEFVVTQMMMMRGKTGERNYQTFNGASYISTPYVICDDDFIFDVEGQFSANGFYMLATKNTETSRVVMAPSGAWYFNNEKLGVLSDSDFAAMTDGSIRSLEIKRVSGALKITDSELGLVISSYFTASLKFDSICSKWSGSTGVPYFTGDAFNIKLTGATSVGGDTSINSLEYKLDEPWSEEHIAYDSANAGDATNGVKVNDVETDYTYA